MKKLTLRFFIPSLTILEAFCAIFFLWKPSETGLSLIRSGFILIVFIAACLIWAGWLWYFKKNGPVIFMRLALKRSIIEKTILCLFFTSVISFTIAIASQFYYDHPPVDHIIRYIRQAVPALIFFGFYLIQGSFVLFYLLFKLEKRIGQTCRRIFLNGRIVWQTALIFLACLLLMGAFFPLRKNYYPSYDYSIFSYIGQQIRNGKIPYLEIWDHKPPMVFYLDAFGLFLADGSLTGIWLLELFALFTGAFILFKLLSRFFPESITLSAVILIILHYVRVFDFGNYTEEYALFFQILALGLFFSRFWKTRPFLSGLTSGLLCGLAFTCKQNTIGIWVTFSIMEILSWIQWKKDRKEIIHRWIFFLFGLIAINGIWAFYFWNKGALQEYWDVAFLYNLIYSEQSAANRWATGLTTLTFLPGISIFLSSGFLSWLIVFIRFLNSLRMKSGSFFGSIENPPILLWAFLSLPIELLLAGLSGMNYQHYFILCFPPVCVLVIWLGMRIYDFLNTNMKTQTAVFLVILLFIVTSIPIVSLYRENYNPRMPSVYTKTADFLKENTNKTDPVIIWGGGLASYVLAERSAPTRFFNVRPLYLFPGYVQEKQWSQFLYDLKQNPPRFIIYTNESYLAKIPFSDSGFCSELNLADYQLETYNFLCQNYQYRETINEGMNDQWGVFERIQGGKQ